MTDKHLLGKIFTTLVPGLKEQKTSSGLVINVDVSGTTSVSSGSMSELALKRFDEMRDTKEDSSEKTA
jgi:hypothetical protein